MKKYLIVSLLLIISSFAESQITSGDTFDTTVVGNIGGNRRKWKAVINLSGSIRTNGDSSISATSGSTSIAGAALWDSLITGASSFELKIDSLGPVTSAPSWYIFSQVPDSNFNNWTGYRIKWVHTSSAGLDPITLERVTTGTSFTVLATINRALSSGDILRMYELGGGWHALVVIRSGSTIDSVSANDVTTQRNTWRWGMRGFHFSTGVMKMDNMVIRVIGALSPRDSVPPVIVSLIQSPSAPLITDPVTLTLRATDDYGLDSLYIRFGHQETGVMTDVLKVMCGTTKDTTISFSAGTQTLGGYIMQARVTDDSVGASGTHITTNSIITFTVDTARINDRNLKVIENFNGANGSVAFTRKWVKVPGYKNANVIDTTATLSRVGNLGQGTTSFAGSGNFGVLAWDSVQNASDYPQAGFIIKQLPTVEDRSLMIFFRKPTKDWLGVGYRVDVHHWLSGIDSVYIQRIDTASGAPVFTRTAFNVNARMATHLSVGDTIVARADGLNVIKGFVRHATGLVDSCFGNANTYKPTSWYFVFRINNEGWLIDDIMTGLTPQPPLPPRDTVDRTPPTITNSDVVFLKPDSLFGTSSVLDDSTLPNYASGLVQLYQRMYKVVTSGATPTDSLIDSVGVAPPYKTLQTSISTVAKTFGIGSYKSMITAKDSAGNITTFVKPFAVGTQSPLFITVYYPNWMFKPFGTGGYYDFYGIPPWETKFTGVTHIIQFGDVNVTTTPPYFQPIGGMPDSAKWTIGTSTTGIFYRDSLVKYGHLANAKVLTCIQQAQSGTALQTITSDSATTDAFCINVVLYCLRNKFDGTDINWENNEPTPTQSSLLLRRLRFWFTSLNTWNGQKAVITITPPSGSFTGVYNPTVVNANVDQINPQLYSNSVCWNNAISCNGNWFVNPLRNGTAGVNYPSNFEAHSYESRGPAQWVAAGFSKSIMGAGIAAFARAGIGSNQLFGGQTISGCTSGGQDDIGLNTKARLLDPAFGGQIYYDTLRHGHAIFGTAPSALDYHKFTISAGQQYWYMYPDETNDIPDVVQWTRSNGYGGLMIYSMASDGEPTRPFDSRFLITNAVIAAVANSTAPPLPPAIPVLVAPTDSAINQAILLTLSWSSVVGTTSYHLQLSTDCTFTSPPSIPFFDASIFTTAFSTGISGIPPLAYNTKYFWRVASENGAQVSSYTPTRRFTTITAPIVIANPPPTPILSTPINNSTGQSTTINFVWQKANIADTVTIFQFQLGQDSGFVFPNINDSSLTSAQTSRIVSGLAPATIYYWRVRAGNTSIAKWSAYTSKFKLTTLTISGGGTIFAQKTGVLWYNEQTRGWSTDPRGSGETELLIDPALWQDPDTSGYPNAIRRYAQGYKPRGAPSIVFGTGGTPLSGAGWIALGNGNVTNNWTSYHVFGAGLSSTDGIFNTFNINTVDGLKRGSISFLNGGFNTAVQFRNIPLFTAVAAQDTSLWLPTRTDDINNRGSGAFSGVNTTVSIVILGAITTDRYWIQYTGSIAPLAADACVLNTTSTGFVLTRSVGGTSNIAFNWLRMR